jgi:hypothetical protein
VVAFGLSAGRKARFEQAFLAQTLRRGWR